MNPRMKWPLLVSIVVILGLSGCGSGESESPSLRIGPSMDLEAAVPAVEPVTLEKWAEHTQGLPGLWILREPVCGRNKEK